jgi:dihydrofolate reductase
VCFVVRQSWLFWPLGFSKGSWLLFVCFVCFVVKNIRLLALLVVASVAPVRMAAMEIALIAAVARNGIIGANGVLPWRIPTDLQHFRELTNGHSVIFGRKTWDGIAKQLPGRYPIVLSRNPAYAPPFAVAANSVEAALKLAAAHSPKMVFVAGGAEIYSLFLPLASRAYITHIESDFPGDAFFPPLGSEWKEITRCQQVREASGSFTFSFAEYSKSL